MSTATALPVFKDTRIIRIRAIGNSPKTIPHKTVLHKPLVFALSSSFFQSHIENNTSIIEYYLLAFFLLIKKLVELIAIIKHLLNLVLILIPEPRTYSGKFFS